MSISPLGQQVRQQDPDRFATILFAPVHIREGLFALAAFNQELARIRDKVREPSLGLIRLQWWREAVEDLAKGLVREHDVLRGLAPLVNEELVTVEELSILIDARECEYEEIPLKSRGEFISYVKNTAGQLQKLCALGLGIKDPEILMGAENSGIALGIAGLLRAAPYESQPLKFLPPAANKQDLLKEAESYLHKSRHKAPRAIFGLNALSKVYIKKLKRQDNPRIHFRMLRIYLS